MKITLILLFIVVLVLSCSTPRTFENKEDLVGIPADTIRIANEELEYEVIIIEPGFNAWLEVTAQPRNFYNQTYLESRNRIWVINYNIRAIDRTNYDPQLYELPIDYKSTIDYGYEVNYLLYNYFVYFQLRYKQRLGTFSPRI